MQVDLPGQTHLRLYQHNTGNSSYLLRVLEPVTWGLNNVSQEEFLSRIILSCNLLLDDSIFSLHEINPTELEAVNLSEELSLISKLPPEKAFKINHTKSWKRDKRKIIYLYEFLHEADIFRLMMMLNRLYDMSVSDKIQVSDLKNRLNNSHWP